MRFIYSAIAVCMLLIGTSTHASQAPAKKNEKTVSNLQNLAARQLASQILAAITNAPANAEDAIPSHIPTAQRVMAQFKKLNVSQPTYAAVAYHVMNYFIGLPSTTPAEKRIAIMEILPLMLHYSTSPIAMLPVFQQGINSLPSLPYDTSVGPWFMNFMEHMAKFLNRPQNDTKYLMLTFIFGRNQWTRADKIDFIARVGQWIEAKEQQAKQTTNPPVVIGTASKNILRLLKEVITDDESGSTTFDWSTKLVFEQADFSYPIFSITIANDPIALNALIKASGQQALEAINFTNGEELNALTFAARSKGLLAITEALLKNGAAISASFISPDDGLIYVIYDALAEATERNDIEKVKAMLTLAPDRIDDGILENAQEIAAGNNYTEIMQLLDAEVRKRNQEQ